jgi:hypothetical protein
VGRTTTAVRCDGRAAAMLIALVGIVAAACGTAGPVQPGARSRTSVTARPVVPPGGSPAEARAVGRRMLASLILPPGSRRIGPRSQPPRSGLIGGQNVVDVSRFYWLPLPEEAAASFLQHHVPAGTDVSGTGSGEAFVAMQYSLKAPPAGLEKYSSMLLATLAVGPNGGTLLRADAELTWYPPRSAAEYLPPSGYRSVKVTATFTSPLGRAKPRTITRVFTSQAVLARLARLLDGMHATAPWTGSCPALLPQFRIVFAPKRNGNSKARPVSVTPSGCRGELLTTEGMLQPALEDIGSMRLLAVIGPLLDAHRHYW